MEFITNNSIPFLANGSGIHIKEENKGKFTETKKRTGKSTEELTHSKNPLTRKRAIFAQNAKKWKHEEGGSIHKPFGHRAITDNGQISTKELKKNHPLTFGEGGMIPKFQWSGPIFTKQTREQMQKSTSDAVDVVKAASKKASDAYAAFSDSPWNTVYDVVNTGLYMAAPFTGGVTLVPAMAMSIGQGLAAANNMANEGVSLNNGLDVAGGVLAAPAKVVAKPLMKAVGKSTKYVKNAKLFKTTKDSYKVGKFQLGKTHASMLDLSRKSKKYWPYFGYALAVPAVGNAQIANDVKDNYNTYVAPWIGYNQKIAQRVQQETNKRK